MWGVLIQIVMYLIQIGIILFLFSIKLTWKLVKYEFFWIKWSFKRYPFAFFSFFLHFVGYWGAMYLAEAENVTWLLKIYTFGLASDAYEALAVSVWPVAIFFELITKIPPESIWSDIAFGVFIIAVILLWLVLVIVFVESVILIFPLLHAILTQLVLGIVCRPFLLRWRQRRTDKFYEKIHKRSQNDPEVQKLNELSRSLSAQWDAQDMAAIQSQRSVNGYGAGTVVSTTQESASGNLDITNELRKMGLNPKERLNPDGTGTGIIETVLPSNGPAKKVLREFDETYNRAYEKTVDMSMRSYQMLAALREWYGKNSKVESMYSDMLEKHYDMVECYVETAEFVWYTENSAGIPKAYEKFKRKVIMTKNAQEEFVKILKETYGEKLIQEMLRELSR